MRKITSLLVMLLVAITGVWAQTYAPVTRVTALQEGTQYMIYNTAYTGGTYANRYGFIYYDGSVKNYGGSVPETFSTSNLNYLFTVTDNGNGTYTLNSVGQNAAVGSAYTFTAWQDATSGKGSAQSRNDDGTYTANADIDASTAVWLINNGSNYWNGNNWSSVGNNCFATWTDGHPYAIYTVQEVVDLSASETVLANNIWTLQELYGVTASDKIYTESSDASEGNIPALLDNSYSTFHHSDWHGTAATPHWVTYELTDAADAVRFYIKQRSNGTGRPTSVTVSGSNDNSTFTEITTLSMTWGGSPLDTYSAVATDGTSYKYWRFTVNATNSTTNSWFCASEWYVLPNNATVAAFFDAANALRAASSTSDNTVRNAAVDAVAAAKQTLDDDVAAHTKYTVTYQVLASDNSVLAQSTEELYGGTKVSTLPSSMYHTMFYDYTTLAETEITSDVVLSVTATVKEAPVFNFTADATDPVWYYLKLKNANYPTYVSDGTPNVTLPTSNANNETVQWAFIGNPYAGFQIVNKAAGTSLVLGSADAANDGNDGGNTYATLAAAGSQTYELWFPEASSNATNGFYLRNAAGQALNQRSTANLAYWASGADLGSTFTATAVPADAELFNQVIAQLEAYPYGTGLNQYSLVVESMDYTSQAATIISGLKTAGYSADNLTNAQLMLAGTSLNMPATGKAYRFKANATGQYIGTAASGSQPMVDGAENAGIYIYTADNYLVSYDQGRYVSGATGNAVGALGGSGVAFTITESGYSTPTLGTYRIRVSDNSKGSLIAWTDGYLNGWGAGDNALCEWTIEEVTELPVSISAAGQATVCLPVAWEVPAGLTVRYATTEHDGLLTVEDATATTIAAGEPVILVGAEGTYNVTIVETADALTGNLLTGTGNSGVSVAAETKAYVLALNGENKVVFSLLNDSERNIEAFKAYYISTAAGEAPAFLLFDEGDVTGINAVNAAAQNGAAVYDLQGRRVSNAQKGVYIINGQKVLVK
ncbi:MAG: discoidin domain-containing protein [Bacteroidaceae bacterium]|nr:discoidin domain-containing protein [Bacteroidaceae bacterium]